MDTPATDAQDQADMARLVQGHDPALNSLMDRHAPALFHFLCRMLATNPTPADLAQETFVSRLPRPATHSSPGQKFSAWLFTIAPPTWPATSCAGASRPSQPLPRRRVRRPRPDPRRRPARLLPDTGPVRGGCGAGPGRARRSANPARRHAPGRRLVRMQDLPVAEAATLLQSTTKAVESRLYRARQILREKLRAWL